MGRSIHESIILASEGVNCMDRSLYGKNLALKADIRKAFDTLHWGFLLQALSDFGWSLKLLRELDKACRSFIWTGSTLRKLSTSVNWEKTRAIKNKAELATSTVWNEVRQTIQELVVHSFYTIGLGDMIYFWRDNWLGYRIVDKLKIPDYMLPYFNQRISDCYNDDSWHFTVNFIVRFSKIAFDIIATPISGNKDERAWINSNFGDVTASTAFSHLRPSFSKVNWGSWIWGHFILVRRSLLVWRAIMGRLPTFDLCRCHGTLGPSRCILCCRDEETTDHILCSCSFTGAIWREFLGWYNTAAHIEDVGCFIIFAMNFEGGDQVRNLWRVGVVSLLWAIWMHRNDIIYNNMAPSKIHILKLVKVFIIEAASNFNLGSMNNSISDLLILRNLAVTGRPRQPPTQVSVFWSLPLPNWVKINTDGLIRESSIMHAGGVSRNAFNEVVGCYHFSVGHGAALEAKLLAIIIAMETAYWMGWSHVWFDSDSSFVVSLLHARASKVPWRFKARWK
ncbi:uncharacterized protein LOC130998208 [Salvia miltiorrhiza]|uniref:uncharacterized protein LOC130998208 n=1 Tax=Salvia miltiorrhiza TaxID=226208 RepID=UPI0025ABFAED|nr:uncharacterized protein LOC130998208 [Salvia miltiorrhiza]